MVHGEQIMLCGVVALSAFRRGDISLRRDVDRAADRLAENGAVCVTRRTLLLFLRFSSSPQRAAVLNVIVVSGCG